MLPYIQFTSNGKKQSLILNTNIQINQQICNYILVTNY